MIILSILKWLLLHLNLGATLIEEAVPSVPVWLITLISIFGGLYAYAHHNGELSCEASLATAEIMKEKNDAKITKTIVNLNNKQLDKQLLLYYRD
jgi:hypothetical protein